MAVGDLAFFITLYGFIAEYYRNQEVDKGIHIMCICVCVWYDTCR